MSWSLSSSSSSASRVSSAEKKMAACLDDWRLEAANVGDDEARRSQLREALEADIKEELRATAQQRKTGSDATARLYKDAQRRANKSLAGAAPPAGTPPSPKDAAAQARSAALLSEMEARKQSEAHSLNLKSGLREVPALYRVGRPASPLPDKSYQELLYEEGMLGKEERERWRSESCTLLKACEQRECTFSPSINAHSRALASGTPPLRRRAAEVLEEQRARRQQLVHTVELAQRPDPPRSQRGASSLSVSSGGTSGGRTHEQVVSELARRGEQLERKKQEARAAAEAEARAGETFSPVVRPRARSVSGTKEGTGSGQVAVGERLHALAHAPPSPAATTKPLKENRPLSAKGEQLLVDALYGDAAEHRARREAKQREAEESLQEERTRSRLSSRSRRLAKSRGTREIAALYAEAGASTAEGGGLDLPQFLAVLCKMGLARAGASRPSTPLTSRSPGSPQRRLAETPPASRSGGRQGEVAHAAAALPRPRVLAARRETALATPVAVTGEQRDVAGQLWRALACGERVPLSRFAAFMLDDHPVDGFSPAARRSASCGTEDLSPAARHATLFSDRRRSRSSSSPSRPSGLVRSRRARSRAPRSQPSRRRRGVLPRARRGAPLTRSTPSLSCSTTTRPRGAPSAR